MTKDLKCCPFCGAKHVKFADETKNPDYFSYFFCVICNATVGFETDNQEEIKEKWNKRSGKGNRR